MMRVMQSGLDDFLSKPAKSPLAALIFVACWPIEAQTGLRRIHRF